MLKGSKKKIVYLDQNWLSNITKAHLDEETRVDRAYYSRLFEALDHAITEDRIVCPTASFHERESNLSSRLNTDFRSMGNFLSRGLEFNHIHILCHEQLLEAATVFVGESTSARPWWQIPFNQDPDVPDSSLPRSASGLEVFVTIQSLVDEDRRIKTRVSSPMYKQYKESRARYGLNYQDEATFSRIQLLKEHYYAFENAESIVMEAFLDGGPILAETIREQKLGLVELGKICDTAGGIGQFIASKDFESAPFLSTRAKLMAADVVYDSAREPESSLLADFDIAATVVPYVDVFLTENYLAELLRKTKVDNDYGCRVFTMRRKEDVLLYLSEL